MKVGCTQGSAAHRAELDTYTQGAAEPHKKDLLQRPHAHTNRKTPSSLGGAHQGSHTQHAGQACVVDKGKTTYRFERHATYMYHHQPCKPVYTKARPTQHFARRLIAAQSADLGRTEIPKSKTQGAQPRPWFRGVPTKNSTCHKLLKKVLSVALPVCARRGMADTRLQACL